MKSIEHDHLLAEYALGSFDEARRIEILSILEQGNGSYAQELKDIEEAMCLLPLGLVPIQAPPEVKAELLSRIRNIQSHAAPSTNIQTAWTWSTPVLSALAACFLGLMLGYLSTIRTHFAKLGNDVRDRGILGNNQESVPSISVPALKFASLAATDSIAADPDKESTPKIRHFTFVLDSLTGQVHVILVGLPRPPVGCECRVQLTSYGKQQKSVSTLRFSESGFASAILDLTPTQDNSFEIDEVANALVFQECSVNGIAQAQGIKLNASIRFKF